MNTDLLMMAKMSEIGGTFWRTVEAMWQSPDDRPVLLATMAFGVVFGLVAFPFGRRIVLALRSRKTTRDSDR